MLRFLIFLCLPLVLSADERWLELHSGPFEVQTDAGDRAGGEALAQLEQLRWALGSVLRNEDLKTDWPVRILALKRPPSSGTLTLARDAYVGAMASNAPVPPTIMREVARLLLESNTMRLPGGIEPGLIDFYSTEELKGTTIVAGKPVPESERNLNWARIHLLTVSPDYYGKMRVLLYNLQQGADPDPAFRNAFGKSQREIERQAEAYLKAGNFQTTEISGRAINARRDFVPKPFVSPGPEISLADLAGTSAAYQAVLKKFPKSAAALEGLGFAAFRGGDKDEARKQFDAATAAGSTNARVWLDLFRLTGNRAALDKASQLNPNWAEPHAAAAESETDGRKKVQELRAATKLEPRNGAYWQMLARACVAQNLYADASKAWAAARRAAVDDAERQKIDAAERAIEQQRLAYEAAERKRKEEEARRDVERARQNAMAEVRAAEARANAKSGPAPANVQPWFTGDTASARIEGLLRQIDCIRGGARLAILGPDRKLTRVMIREPNKILVIGGGTLDLTCGVQRRPRTVAIEYFPKPDKALGTAGDVATLEYK